VSRRPLGLALGCSLGAVALYLGVTRPARAERDAARAEFSALRVEREALRARAADLARRAAAAEAPAGAAAAVTALRASMLRAAEGLPVTGVRLAAEAGGRGAVAARGRLTAEGDQEDLLHLADRLAETSSGVQIDSLEIRESADDLLRLEVAVHTERGPASVEAPGGRP
jgi:hypothetical protein